MSDELILKLSCPDRPGIVRAVSGAITELGGNIVESQQFGDTTSGNFHMRVETERIADPDGFRNRMANMGQALNMAWEVSAKDRKIPTVIMASKEGHCLSDLLYHTKEGKIQIEVAAIVANHETLRPLADFYGVPFIYIPVTKETKPEAEAALLKVIEDTGAELVVLARYMQILSDKVCEAMEGRVINIHHSFLPSFKGARPYAQAHARGVKLIGATAHYVTPDLDEGPIIEQDVVRVKHSDSVSELMSQGEDVERRVLTRAVRWHAEQRVLINGTSTVVFA
ncbi:MAG: formyltetrahydrofolate deformylase [Ancrocorticia sp.]|uniref:formyltetrahydrofolate deformylase n=1 Tax=Ancrocorticia sp. TaxID=2593684 RepID=UPI003F8E3B49